MKELGIALYNSSCVAEDLGKIFDIYWIAGNSSTLPSKWPDTVSTIYNSKNPLQVNLNNQNTLLYISVGSFCILNYYTMPIIVPADIFLYIISTFFIYIFVYIISTFFFRVHLISCRQMVEQMT